jgi:NAD(P)-dependent dehydrogenase (short-subunit alcohol dehydrogenase family)
VRIVRPIKGTPRLMIEFDPRPDYARITPRLMESGNSLHVEDSHVRLRLMGDAPMSFIAARTAVTLSNFSGNVDGQAVKASGHVPMDDAGWRYVIESNLVSYVACTKGAIERIKAGGGKDGMIILVGSISVHIKAVGESVYNAAKGGVLMHTRSTANELGPHGIRVNTVSPGLIDREGLDQTWPDGVRRWQAAAPLGRLGHVSDVADACLFLASPAARWVTGAELIVDGGVLTKQIY